MTETPGDYLDQKPLSGGGPAGSCDTGSDHPSAGPVDRPAGADDTGVPPDVVPDPEDGAAPDR